MEKSAINWLKLLMILAILVTIGLIIYVVVLSVQHARMGKIVINVIPKDSIVLVDGKTSKKTVYVKPGTHVVEATKDGFAPSTVSVSVNKQEVRNVYLLPTPVSAEAKQWLEDHPEIQRQREEFASANVSFLQKTIQSNYPIISYLPYETNNIKVNYGISLKYPNDPTKIAVYITSKPEDREVALDWIRAKGTDPSKLEIIYKNP
jgi:hypothetical protein